MAWKVKVTRQNVDRMSVVASSLKKHIARLLADVETFPLEINFEGYRVFFEKPEDVHSFIRYLDEQVANVRAAA